jgi:hypothetical protein
MTLTLSQEKALCSHFRSIQKERSKANTSTNTKSEEGTVFSHQVHTERKVSHQRSFIQTERKVGHRCRRKGQSSIEKERLIILVHLSLNFFFGEILKKFYFKIDLLYERSSFYYKENMTTDTSMSTEEIIYQY